jgi:hypothetical protein
MTEHTARSFHNYVVLSGKVQGIQHRQSKAGKPYAVAQGYIATGFSRESMPVRIVALNEISMELREGNQILIGRLGYEESKPNNQLLSQIIFYVQRIESFPTDGKLRNLAIFTLRLGDNALPRQSQNGKPWIQVRAALPQGKDRQGAYKPSLWLNLKAFPRSDQDPGIIYTLAEFGKGDLVNITGQVHYEVYRGKGSLSVIASRVDPFGSRRETHTTQDMEPANRQVPCQKEPVGSTMGAK